MADTQPLGRGVVRLDWGGVGEWHGPNRMECIASTGKTNAAILVLNYRVKSKGGLRGRIAGAGFESHHSISGRVGCVGWRQSYEHYRK